jgi:hypothetical protein
MTEDSTAAVQIALAYYQAWTSHDFDQAMTYVAERTSSASHRRAGTKARKPSGDSWGRSCSSSPALT